jgi:catechol 2,3-dioxygenase-like lactoylglutathione lyase family enzyme
MFSRATIVLRVRNAEKSAAFYEALLSAKPARRTPSMASFETDRPPLLLTVEESRRGTRRSRFSLWVETPRQVGDTAIALRRAGASLRLEDRGLEALDPDGNAWRIRLASPSQALATPPEQEEREP